MENDMKLPDGEKCMNCAHFSRCVMLFRCKSDNTVCDWSPSRFHKKQVIGRARTN